MDKPGKQCFYISDHPNLAPVYTKPDSGQERYGGWSLEGVQRYINVKKAARKARNTPVGLQWERDLLVKLREHKNITAATHEEQQRLNGRGRAPAARAAANISAAALFDEDDDSGDEVNLEVAAV